MTARQARSLLTPTWGKLSPEQQDAEVQASRSVGEVVEELTLRGYDVDYNRLGYIARRDDMRPAKMGGKHASWRRVEIETASIALAGLNAYTAHGWAALADGYELFQAITALNVKLSDGKAKSERELVKVLLAPDARDIRRVVYLTPAEAKKAGLK